MEKLEELLRKARSGELRGVAIASLDSEDNVYADWVKAPGTTVLELLGAASMLVSKLDRDMRGV